MKGSRGALVLSAGTRKSFTLVWVFLFVLSLLLQYARFATPPSVAAVHDLGLFELDGNAVNGAAAGNDWDQVYADTSAATSTQFITDLTDSQNDDSFTGGSTKDDLPTSGWLWKKAKVGQPKNDIANAFAAAYTATNGDTIAYFGLDKIEADGNNFAGFWFFKNTVGKSGDGNPPGSPFTGNHAVGDILVLANYTNGGSVAHFDVYKWVGSGGNVNGTLQTVETGVECGAEANDDACGKTNAALENSPWPFQGRDTAANKFGPGTFFEAGLNLSALELDTGCFTTFLAETRASQSVDATLSDFALGEFSFCEKPELTTDVSDSSITIGGTVTDTAALSGTKGEVTGTVKFFVCGPSASAPDCDGETEAKTGEQVGDPVTIADEEATSEAFEPSAVGTYCFRAEYTPAAGSHYLATSHTNTTTECFEVTKKQPAIVTTANETVSSGDEISDSATLSGATSDAGGTITFRAYGPDDANCDGTPAFTSSAVAVDGNGSYGPVSFTPASAGTYHWIASYSGDAKNEPIAGECGDAGENDTVNKVTPEISTTASGTVTVGGDVSDVAHLSGTVNATGTITFNLYGPDDDTCTGDAIFTDTADVDGDDDYTSATFTTAAAGTYRWIASYSGDDNNEAVSGECNDTNESVVVSPASPQISTTATEGAVIGGKISDIAHLTGTFNGTGTITFKLYGPSDATCSNDPIFTDTVDVDGDDDYTSGDFTANAAGTYHWIASYSGDDNNDPVSGTCGDEGEQTVVSQNAPTISTVLHSGQASGATLTVLFGSSVTDQASLSGASSDAGGTVTYTVYSDSDCETVFAAAGTKTVTDGSVPASDAVTFPGTGTFYWQAHYSGDSNNAPATSICTDEVLTVTSPNIHAEKTVDGEHETSADPGDTLHFEIEVTNSGDAAGDVTVSDDISALLAHGTYNDDASDGGTLNGSTLEWDTFSLAAGAPPKILTFTITLDDTGWPIGMTELPNVVVVLGEGSNCPAEGGDEDCETSTTVNQPELTIEKSFTGNTLPDVAGHDQAAVGDTLTYTLAYTLTNGPVHNAKIDDVLPAGLADGAPFEISDGGTYDSASRTITWLLGTLESGGTVSYKIKVAATAPSVVDQPFVNTATIRSDETLPDSDTAEVLVPAPPKNLTPPNTATDPSAASSSNPGSSLLLVLLGIAGLVTVLGFLTPVPARARRRQRRR